MGDCYIDSLDSFKNTHSFINETTLSLLGDLQQLSCGFFELIVLIK